MWKKIRKYVKILIWNALKFIFSPFIKVDNSLMLFGTAIEKFADNPKYLFLYVVNNEKQFKPVWITNNEKVLKELRKQGYKTVKKDSFKAFLLAMKAKYFFFSHNIEDIFYFKRKETIAVNLWHGSPLKAIGFDSKVEMKWIRRRKKFRLKLPYEEWNYIVVANEMWIPYFKSSMKIPERKILPLGLPRNDILWKVKENSAVQSKIKDKVFKQLRIQDRTKRVILYAPTFRDEEKLSNSLIEETKKLIKIFKQILSNSEYVLLLRFHPLDNAKLDKRFVDSECVFNVTDYDDMYELLSITDIFISDYSSSIFDFSILERPTILYWFDIKNYSKARGGLYNTVDKSCFIIANNRKELISIMKKLLKGRINTVSNQCSRKYNLPGSSCKRLLDFIKTI